MLLLEGAMPGAGTEVLRRLIKPSFPIKEMPGVILMGGDHEERLLRDTMKLGVCEVLPKPVNWDRLELAIRVQLALYVQN